MAYEVKVIGMDGAITVEDSISIEAIREAWVLFRTGKGPNKTVEIGKYTGDLKGIRFFFKVSNQPSQSKGTDEIDVRDRALVRDRRSMTPKERSMSTAFFKLLYVGFYKNTPSEVQLVQACDIQEKFFTENPRRTYCDPSAFRSIIKKKKCNDMTLRVVESIIRQDKFAEKYL